MWPLHFRHANQPCWRNLNHYHTFLTGEEPGPQSTWHLDGWNIKMLLPRLYWQQGGTAAYGPNHQHQGTYIQSPKPLLILLLTTMGLTSYCYNKSLSCTMMRANISTKIRSSDISWLAINPRHPCDQLGNQSQTAARTAKVRMTQRTNICTVLHPITPRSFCSYIPDDSQPTHNYFWTPPPDVIINRHRYLPCLMVGAAHSPCRRTLNHMRDCHFCLSKKTPQTRWSWME